MSRLQDFLKMLHLANQLGDKKTAAAIKVEIGKLRAGGA